MSARNVIEMDTDVFGFDLYDGETEDQYYASQGRYYCKHGVYIGSPGGADYMCGACEDGISDEDYAAGIKAQNERLAKKQAEKAALDLAVEAVRVGDVSLANLIFRERFGSDLSGSVQRRVSL